MWNWLDSFHRRNIWEAGNIVIICTPYNVIILLEKYSRHLSQNRPYFSPIPNEYDIILLLNRLIQFNRDIYLSPNLPEFTIYPISMETASHYRSETFMLTLDLICDFSFQWELQVNLQTDKLVSVLSSIVLLTVCGGDLEKLAKYWFFIWAFKVHTPGRKEQENIYRHNPGHQSTARRQPCHKRTEQIHQIHLI